jgi:hypothetical protein
MALLRIYKSPNLNALDVEPLNFEKITNAWFANCKAERQSVYQANTPLEEVEAVSAFALSNHQVIGLTVYHIIRIDWADLEALGAHTQVSDDPGTTGVVPVDFRHRDIPGDPGLLLDLVRRVRSEAERGEDRFRWLATFMQRRQLERFLACSEVVIQEAKRRCERKLANSPYAPRPTHERVRHELEAAPPAVPQQRIATLAHQLHQQRQGATRSLENWLDAEREVRQRYVAGLLGEGL